jgi:hypothetical protein
MDLLGALDAPFLFYQGAMRVTAAARPPATLSLGWQLLFRSNFESFDVFKRLTKCSRHFLIEIVVAIGPCQNVGYLIVR